MSEIPEIDPEIADLTHPAAHFLPGERVLRADEADRIRRSALDRQAREIVEALRERVLMRAAADFIEKGDTELPDSGWTRRDCILADLYATRERADRALEALTGAVGRLRAETEEDMAHWPGVTDPRSAVAALRHAADLIEKGDTDA